MPFTALSDKSDLFWSRIGRNVEWAENLDVAEVAAI